MLTWLAFALICAVLAAAIYRFGGWLDNVEERLRDIETRSHGDGK